MKLRIAKKIIRNTRDYKQYSRYSRTQLGIAWDRLNKSYRRWFANGNPRFCSKTFRNGHWDPEISSKQNVPF